MLQEPRDCTDSGVARKGEFFICGEDVDFADRRGGGVSGVDEDGFGEVEFAGDDLFLGLCDGVVGGEEDHAQRVTGVGGGCEDVEGEEAEGLRHFDCCLQLIKKWF